MKKLIFILIAVVSTTVTACAQSQTREYPVYKLFPTANMWTFIKLNTRTGRMWQVQFDVKDNNRFEVILSERVLVEKEQEANGRFELYSTTNMWTFLLLDQIDGRTWQVQWSQEPENRGIVPIE